MKPGNPSDRIGSPRSGEPFHCDACGRDSVAKVKKVMDGWTCVGEHVVCALCGAVLDTGDDASIEESAAASWGRSEGLDALASLLGADAGAEAPGVDLGESDGRFCKNCRHFLRHPFQSRCLFHDRDVEPMNDCEDFDPVPSPDGPAGDDADTDSADDGAGKDTCEER